MPPMTPFWVWGQHHLAHHLPGGAAEAVGRLAQDRRHDLEHVAHHGGDVRQDHEGQHDAGGQDAHAVDGAAEHPADERHATQHLLQRRLHEVSEDRREHEQAEHAVDDRRHGSQQFDGGAERAAHPDRAVLGQEQRDAEGQRHGDDESDAGTQDGADDGDGGAELLVDDVPFHRPQELEAELLERRPRVQEQRDDDAHQRRQHQQRERLRAAMEQHVLPALAARDRRHAGRCDAGLLFLGWRHAIEGCHSHAHAVLVAVIIGSLVTKRPNRPRAGLSGRFLGAKLPGRLTWRSATRPWSGSARSGCRAGPRSRARKPSSCRS